MAKTKKVIVVCDWCKKEGKDTKELKFNGKKYDICTGCIAEIELKLKAEN